MVPYDTSPSSRPANCTVERHVHWFGERLVPDLLDAILVTTGRHAYRRARERELGMRELRLPLEVPTGTGDDG